MKVASGGDCRVPAGAQGRAVRSRFGAHAVIRRNRHRRRRCVADALAPRLARSRQGAGDGGDPCAAVAARQPAFADFEDALDKGKRVATRVNRSRRRSPAEEIARMLAGPEITAEARAAAERLLRAATGVTAPSPRLRPLCGRGLG